MNDGKCRGVNKCRCPSGFYGNHCEIGRHQRSVCKKPCKFGICLSTGYCSCDEGWAGKFCNRRVGEPRRKKILT